MSSEYTLRTSLPLKLRVIAIACSMACSPALAGAFQLTEHSSAGLGRSYAGEGAIADTAATASRNPAAIMMFDRPGISVGAVFVDPAIHIAGKSATGESLDINNVAPTAWVPNLHLVVPLNSRFGVAASLFSNYGLGTKYNPAYPAGEVSGTTALASINANLSAAYRLSPGWSIGAGLNAVYAQAKFDRYSGLYLQQNTPLNLPVGTAIAHINGDGWGYGFNAGILYQFDQNNRYALNWRSKVGITFHGHYRSDLPDNALINYPGSPLPYGSGGKTIDGELMLDLPAIWELSGYNKLASQWAIHYSLMYTRWRQFEYINAKGDRGQRLFYRYQGFHDSWRAAIATSWYLNQQWTLRAGVAFDQSPIPKENRSVAIPDQNRIWLAFGGSYLFTPDVSVDFGVAWMYGQKLRIDDWPYENLRSRSTAWVYGVNLNYWF